MHIIFRKIILIAICFSSLDGCAKSVSDSAFRVTGSVRNEAGVRMENCKLGIIFKGDGRVSYSQKIDSDFINTVTIEPGNHEVNIIIECDEKKVYESNSIKIQGLSSYESPINLGVVVVDTTTF